MITAKGFDSMAAKLKAGLKKIEDDLNKKHRTLGRKVFTDLVVNSPQWSGNLASNWYITSGSYKPIAGYSSTEWYNQNPYAKGDDPAVSMTLMREVPKLQSLTYKDKIVIGNRTPYASDIEAGIGPNGKMIRDDNKFSEYGGVAMLAYVDMKYKALTGKAKFL